MQCSKAVRPRIPWESAGVNESILNVAHKILKLWVTLILHTLRGNVTLCVVTGF